MRESQDELEWVMMSWSESVWDKVYQSVEEPFLLSCDGLAYDNPNRVFGNKGIKFPLLDAMPYYTIVCYTCNAFGNLQRQTFDEVYD